MESTRWVKEINNQNSKDVDLSQGTVEETGCLVGLFHKRSSHDPNILGEMLAG